MHTNIFYSDFLVYEYNDTEMTRNSAKVFRQAEEGPAMLCTVTTAC